MAIKQRTLSFTDGMALGLGIDDLTGEVGTLEAVSFADIEVAAGDEGMEARYETTVVHSVEQMYDSLGVSVAAEGRYGLFSGEGKVKFAEESRFNSTSTFLVARADIRNAFKRIKSPAPVAHAAQLIADGKQDEFRKQYGDLFIRGIKTGGEYIAVFCITSEEQQTQRDLAASLKASFDGVLASGSIDVAMQAKMSELRQRSEVRVSVYQKGGSGDQISYTGTIEEVMARLKSFASSVQKSAKAYSVQAASYDTLVFPATPNWFDLEKQQQVLEDSMRKRLQLLQVRNDLEVVLLHPTYFESPPNAHTVSDWSTAITDELNALDRHVSKVVDSISAAEYFPLTLPAGLKIPDRIEHSSAQVEVFSHADYAPDSLGIPGRSQKLSLGRYDDSKGQILIGNDQISALKVPDGFAVRGYDHVWFQGAYIDFTADTPAVPMDWNDRISSLIVYKTADGPPVIDYIVALDYPWSRPALLLKTGKYPDLAATSLGVATLSTLLIPTGMKVQVWDQPNFGGETATFFTDVLELPPQWNNRAASLEVSTYTE